MAVNPALRGVSHWLTKVVVSLSTRVRIFTEAQSAQLRRREVGKMKPTFFEPKVRCAFAPPRARTEGPLLSCTPTHPQVCLSLSLLGRHRHGLGRVVAAVLVVPVSIRAASAREPELGAFRELAALCCWILAIGIPARLHDRKRSKIASATASGSRGSLAGVVGAPGPGHFDLLG